MGSLFRDTVRIAAKPLPKSLLETTIGVEPMTCEFAIRCSSTLSYAVKKRASKCQWTFSAI